MTRHGSSSYSLSGLFRRKAVILQAGLGTEQGGEFGIVFKNGPRLSSTSSLAQPAQVWIECLSRALPQSGALPRYLRGPEEPAALGSRASGRHCVGWDKSRGITALTAGSNLNQSWPGIVGSFLKLTVNLFRVILADIKPLYCSPVYNQGLPANLTLMGQKGKNPLFPRPSADWEKERKKKKRYWKIACRPQWRWWRKEACGFFLVPGWEILIGKSVQTHMQECLSC